jgi:hypothetical protein
MSVRVATIAVSIATASFLLSAGASSVVAQNAPGCEVKITTPQPGDKVAKKGWVRGTATIPNGTYLWVLAHLKDLVAEWWPQGDRPAVIDQDGGWVINSFYGSTEDVGQEFEVAVVVVDANTNTRLGQYYTKAREVREYPPIEFPDAVEGCVPVRLTVKKTSH